MDDDRTQKARIVAEKARTTFFAIRELRKTMPQFTRAQKDELLVKIAELQNQWWEEVKMYFAKGPNDPPFYGENK